MTALLTRAEAMSRLRCSESKLERLYRAGKIAYTRIGRAVLFDEQDLAAFVAARKSDSVSHRHVPSCLASTRTM